MKTMTSLQAQNSFGELIDTSQREPVVLTRRGRPVSVLISASGDPVDLQYQFMKTLSALMPLRGKAAVAELNRVLAPVRERVDADGLTEHLKGADFFDVAKFPKASFVSTSIAPKTGDAGVTHEVTGELDLHGVKKTITFPATITVDDRGAKGTAEFKINRKDFNLNWNAPLEAGGFLVGDDVKIELAVEAVRQV